MCSAVTRVSFRSPLNGASIEAFVHFSGDQPERCIVAPREFEEILYRREHAIAKSLGGEFGRLIFAFR